MLGEEVFELEDTVPDNGDDDVTDGSVDYYDFDWGDPVQTREADIFSGCNVDSEGDPTDYCTCQPTPTPTPDCSCEPEDNGDENQDNNEEEEYPIVDV